MSSRFGHVGCLAISVKRSRSQGHVYRQPNTPMNYTTTAVTFPPPPQQTYPISPQGNQAYPQPYPQYPSQPAYPQSGTVQQSANYPPQNKAEPTGLYKNLIKTDYRGSKSYGHVYYGAFSGLSVL